ncbi:MAG: heparinase II/III family protein, partial [Allomuricauda sp.]
MLKRYHDYNFLSEPWDNHTVRSLAFTGLAGLATLGEIPDADEWLDYVIKCYITSFPTWGGDDGGWSQGLAYNSTYNLYQTNFVEALNQCSNVNLYNKPFFRNNGYFGLYCSPPYADRGAFGDGGERSHAPKDKLLMERYAKAYSDPYLLWQAEQIFPEKDGGNGKELLKRGHLWQGYMMEDVIGILNSREMEIEPSNPSSLPSSKLFEDVGWVSMHSDLGDAENDVWMLFKSSPFGSFSHSHADQNSFQINAFGESLLIDSGYYPYYGGPHHFLWTRQTRAHNAILVNGRGQHVQSMAARGKIMDYQTSNGHTIVTAECSPGYNLPMSETVIKH